MHKHIILSFAYGYGTGTVPYGTVRYWYSTLIHINSPYAVNMQYKQVSTGVYITYTGKFVLLVSFRDYEEHASEREGRNKNSNKTLQYGPTDHHTLVIGY